MPAEVIISEVLPDEAGRLIISYRNGVGSGDYNRLFRSTPSEYDGQFICVLDQLPWFYSGFGDFQNVYDFGVASGKTYNYYFQSITGGAVTGTTLTLSGSQTLTSAWLHTVTKRLGNPVETPANAELFMALNDFAPTQQSRSLQTVSRPMANSTTPRMGIGSIRQQYVQIPIWIPFGANDNRATLRAIYKSPYYACLRDRLGNKYTGRLTPPRESYSGVTAGISLALSVLSFSESVA